MSHVLHHSPRAQSKQPDVRQSSITNPPEVNPALLPTRSVYLKALAKTEENEVHQKDSKSLNLPKHLSEAEITDVFKINVGSADLRGDELFNDFLDEHGVAEAEQKPGPTTTTSTQDENFIFPTVQFEAEGTVLGKYFYPSSVEIARFLPPGQDDNYSNLPTVLFLSDEKNLEDEFWQRGEQQNTHEGSTTEDPEPQLVPEVNNMAMPAPTSPEDWGDFLGVCAGDVSSD